MEIKNLKGNCLFHESTSFELNKQEISYLKTLELENNFPHKFFFSKDISIFDNSILNRVKELFSHHINLYTKDILKIDNDIKITNSWLTINKPGSSHHPHKH